MCIPQSSIIFLPPIDNNRQLRPTSWPAPNGVTLMSGIDVTLMSLEHNDSLKTKITFCQYTNNMMSAISAYLLLINIVFTTYRFLDEITIKKNSGIMRQRWKKILFHFRVFADILKIKSNQNRIYFFVFFVSVSPQTTHKSRNLKNQCQSLFWFSLWTWTIQCDCDHNFVLNAFKLYAMQCIYFWNVIFFV